MIAVIAIGVLVIAGATIGGILLAKGTQERTKWGINLAPPTACPRCAMPLPSVRMPASFREAMWGGWTCKGCGLAIDKWGRPRV